MHGSTERGSCEGAVAAATLHNLAGVPEWPKGAGCKPAGSAFRGSNPLPCMGVGETYGFPHRALAGPERCAPISSGESAFEGGGSLLD